MSAPSPQADAAAMLHDNLLLHLEEAEAIGTQYDGWTEEHTESARKLLPHLVLIVRALLAAHDAPGAETCRACAEPWPCAELRTIHRMVKDPSSEFVALVRRLHESDAHPFC